MIVRGAVRPPHGTAFPERALGRISLESRGDSLYRILTILYRAPRGHEFVDEPLVRFLIERRITEPPKASPYHKISTVGCARIVGTGSGRFDDIKRTVHFGSRRSGTHDRRHHLSNLLLRREPVIERVLARKSAFLCKIVGRFGNRAMPLRLFGWIE